MQVVWTNVFTKLFSDVLKKYSRDIDYVKNQIDDIYKNFSDGDVYPHVKPEVKKFRIKLPYYKIGKSNGLRLICMNVNDYFIPIILYKKGQFSKESDVKKTIIETIKKIVDERNNK